MKIYCSDIRNHSIEELLPLVSDERRKRSLKYRFDDDKKRSLLAHVLLNHALIEEGIDIPLPACPIPDENGKPHLKFRDEEIHFSLSHSVDYAVCAISDSPIGVDIEQIKDRHLNIAEHFFNPAELKYCTDAEGFYRVWTLKEGYLKAVGQGMKLPLDSFIVSDLDIDSGSCIYINENGAETGFLGSGIITEDGYALSVTCRQLPKDSLISSCIYVRSLPRSYI